MPTLNQLRGLKASDRTQEEQRAINQQMGYKEKEPEIPVVASMPVRQALEGPETADTMQSAILHNALRYKQHLDEQYEEALAQRRQDYGVDRNSINSSANDYFDKIANEVSSHYKKYKNTDKLPLSDQEKKELAAAYDARRQTYGEDNANIWLDQQMKDKVGENQSWWEQMQYSISHLIPAIEGGAIQAYGMVHGAINHIIGSEGYGDNPDLNGWDSFMDDVLDNPVTRYGKDIEHAGASNVVQGFMNAVGLSDETAAERIAATKATATKYNPEGIGADAIITTQEQDDSFISSATPWQALQSGGFTALSMLVGAGEAKAASWIFGSLAKGARWMNATGKALKTAESLEKALVGIKRAQNITDTFIIPAAVGTMEGGIEGLSTKIDVEREAVQNLDEYYKDKVNKEVEAILGDDNLNPMIEVTSPDGQKMMKRAMSPEDAYKQVWDKYQDEYTEARRQIDWAASKAGIHNFYANSLINGALNQTLKAGIMAPRVQETLRNSRAFSWAYSKPKFNLNAATGEVTSSMSKAGWVGRVLKEPLGEGAEEYAQSLSNDVFSGAAENNINEFIKNKFEGDGTAKVTDSFGSDYAAALTALEGSLVNKESIQSAILGAVSSTMGTVGGIGRGYHRDENGNLVRNSLLDPRNLTRGLNNEGEQESWVDYARRVTPWRSGAINAYFDRRQEMDDANETAATLTEWLKDPQNKAKWDGLTGTANWITQMENAAESNDQFSYRKAQMGKAINDIFMLKKLEGTDFHEAAMADLQKAANGELSQEEIAKMKEQGGEDYQNVSDQEIVEKVQSNANKMLGLMTQVEQESKNLDRLLGRVDEDTKQSLIFGKIMEQDFRERRDQLQEEIDSIKDGIKNSRYSTASKSFEDNVSELMMKYGSLNHAIQSLAELQKRRAKVEQQVSELKAIDKNKTSDKQKETLIKGEKELKRLDKEIEGFNVLYARDEKGKRTDELDGSLQDMVLNEQAIMDLDPVTRAIVLAQGAAKLYNATHQNRQRVDQLNLEIDDINHQIDALEAQKAGWARPDGSIKKGHNKQYERNTKKVAELQKQKEAKMRALDAEQGKQDTKSIYNSAQQEVIDNLVQQGMAQDEDFLDKVVDMGRLDKGIKDYHQQYQAILSDPKAFQNYVQRAKYNAQRDLTRRRAERIANIQNFQEYSQELDRLTANASQQEEYDIMATLAEQDRRQRANMPQEEGGTTVAEDGTPASVEPVKTNFQKWVENNQKKNDLIRQFAKNPNLTANDQSLLVDAMQYLSSNGVDVTDREAAVEALIERDEQGNQGGKFRQYVEAKNDQRLPQQRTFMPVFTSIGQVVSQYVDLINGQQTDAINRGNMQPTVSVAEPQGTVTAASPQPASASNGPSSPSSTPTMQPEQTSQGGPSIFDIGGSTPESGHFVDGDGTVATEAQTQSMQQRQQDESKGDAQKSTLRQLWEKVTSPEIAKMVEDAAGNVANSNESQAVKDLAMQYLEELAVNSDNTYPALDDLMTDVQVQINRLRSQSNMQEKEENDFSKAAGLLQGVYNSLSAKRLRGRKRSAPMPSARPENPKAAWIHTANIAYMESQNPDAWAVRFTNDHAIDEWNRDNHIDKKDPVYFITDSEWTAEVTAQMNNSDDSRNYDTLTDMPIVAAVKVESPKNPASTTAIEVNGQWYQPIGIMPSSKAKSVSGAALTEEIRKIASKEQGRHLVTVNGLPNSQPLITNVYGANYLTAHHPDASSQSKRENNEENNTDIIDDILKSLPRDSEDRLRAMSRQEMLADPEYQEARSKFLDGLQWNGENSGTYENQLTFTPENYRQGEAGNPMIVFTKPMAETVSRNSDETLPEVLENGTSDQIVTFNSRTERLYNEVIRPLFQYMPMTDRTGDKSAKIITQQDIDANPDAYKEECERLSRMLNGYDGSKESKGQKGINDFIYVKSGWSVKVTAPEGLQTIGGDVTKSESVYKIFFINNDPDIAPIEIGEIRMNANGTSTADNTTAAKNLLKNIMWDGQQVRDFLNWQTPKSDAQNLKNPDKAREGKARRNYAALVDDGILTLAGSSIVYDVDGVKLHAPITRDNQGHTRIVFPADKVVNADNAKPATPQNVTPQGEGAVMAGDGSQVLGDSGADLGDGNNGLPLPPSPPRESEKLKRAKEVTRRIIEDSKQFTLSEDGAYYYIKDNVTGEETKYLRVTTIIGADESVPQWTPSIENILNKLKERHPVSDTAYQESYKDSQDMAQKLNIPIADIRRAVAELRTEHKKEGYGAWSTPSTSIGNTFDSITRDFLAGHLKAEYPNVSQDVLNTFVQQLTLFKNDVESRGIHIVSEGVMAHGTITLTDDAENTHEAKVAGTLDLFGYDDNGDFYIFDMKTTRDHKDQKLQNEKSKWSRQISMYADLLKQTYGIEIPTNHLRIIPINVSYPTPMGRREDRLDPTGPVYTEKDGQLQVQYRGHEPEDFNMAVPQQPVESNGDNAVGMRKTDYKGQFQPGYTKFSINWDNLSSEDQDIASALTTQTGGQGQDYNNAPSSASIDTPASREPSFMDTGSVEFEETVEEEQLPPPVIPTGQTETLPQWRRLSNAIKGFLADNYGIEDIDGYNEMLNDTALTEAVQHDLKCHGLI